MAKAIAEFGEELNARAAEFGIEFEAAQVERLTAYYELVLRWNERLHLVAPCSPREFAVRHVLESLLVLKHLPPNASVVDIGSGAGLPIIPCLLVRDDLVVTLFEASTRKAVFLREALRPIRPANRARLMVARFEEVPAPAVDFLTCRALDRFSELLPKIVQWAPPGSTLLLFAGESLRDQVKALLPTTEAELIPQSEKRFLVIGRR